MEIEKPFRLSVFTGDKKGEGSDVGISLIIRDSDGNVSSIIKPDIFLKDDFARGTVSNFEFGPEKGVNPPFELIEIWRDDNKSFAAKIPVLKDCLFKESENKVLHWYLDRIEISVKYHSEVEEELKSPNSTWVFPVHRWIGCDVTDLHYFVFLYDCILPQKDSARKEFRQSELKKKREIYAYAEIIKGAPIMSRDFPVQEAFSSRHYWTFVEKKFTLKAASKLIDWTTLRWKTCEGFANIFKGIYERPMSVDFWKEDWWFALLRLQGIEPTLISLCEAIPQNVSVPDYITDFLEGKSLQDSLNQKKIFKCDLTILKGLQCAEEREVAYPVVLFYLNNASVMVPIMIQLRVGDPPERNPTYTPNDSPNTWLAAKMYYNNAEAQYHQSVTHLGLTHFLIEGVCVAVHRSLSVSHPLFRLMAPHFLYVIAINKRGGDKLINPGGWVDLTMTQGSSGMFELMAKGYSNWTFKNTDPNYQIGNRGILDPKTLPYYPYRDDSINLHCIIKNYVSEIVSNYYDSEATVQSDWELQRFWKELTYDPPCGLGLRGIPRSSRKEEGFHTPKEVIETVTGIIATCTLSHAAINSQQYSQYAFAPNCPIMLNQPPPTEKLTYTEEDLAALLPSKKTALNTIVIANLLSFPITHKLADFEVQYLFHPKDLKAVKRFKDELDELSSEISNRNLTRKKPYNDLDPKNVPNSISI